jgi:hypothetical protein
MLEYPRSPLGWNRGRGNGAVQHVFDRGHEIFGTVATTRRGHKSAKKSVLAISMLPSLSITF